VKKQPTTEEILARLDAYSRRLHGSVEQATSLHAVFWRLNKAALKAKKRDKLWGPLAGTFNIIQHALLRELILIIVRVLDKPRNLETSDKISFVVIGRWLERDEVPQSLIEHARKRHGERWALRSAAIARHAIRRLKQRLHNLETENPNRERLLRNFRDDFLAHELHRDIPRDGPLFGHIMDMVKEIQGLSKDALAACTGAELDFDHVAADAKDGAEQLWRAIVERRFRWHPKRGVEDI
jgi:predicted small metal-binding protein